MVDLSKTNFWSSKNAFNQAPSGALQTLGRTVLVPLFQILSTNNGVLYLCKTLSIWTFRSRSIESLQVLCRLSDKRCRVYLVAMLELMRAKPLPLRPCTHGTVKSYPERPKGKRGS